jgi:hypothetical protein
MRSMHSRIDSELGHSESMSELCNVSSMFKDGVDFAQPRRCLPLKEAQSDV